MTPTVEEPAASPETGTTTESAAAPKRVLVCAHCRFEITRPEAAVERNGSHRHIRINPEGWVHDFGCFAEAAGARPMRAPTTEATWFQGYAWRIALCGSCGTHLGWRYDGEAGSFFGLLTDGLA